MSNALVKTWFAQPILEVYDLISESENNILLNEIQKIQSNVSSGGEGWNASVYNTYEQYSLHDKSVFKNLINLIEIHTKKFALQLGSNADYIVNESWLNCYKKGDYQEYHYHPGSYFSAIYFFKNPNNSGTTIFKSFEEPNMMPLKNLKQNDLSFNTCKYTPKNKTLIIFKSNMQHMVTQSKSDETRITAAFNLK